jgi:cytosine/adenosine deaminase-related metal-dependent hydrolase
VTASGRGFVNAHTHLYSGLAPLGLPAPDPVPASFPEILERVWWRLDRALDEEALRASARLYVAEALLQGTTGVIDHHESPGFIEGSLDVLADACQQLGMPAVLCYGVTERNGGAEEARRGLTECARFFASNERPLVRTAFGVHAAFTVSDETLRELGVVAREIGARVHLHVAEDAVDVEDARARGYDGVLARLLATDALPPGSILAHGVHLSADEVTECAARGFWLVQNPRSNRANGVGYPAALAGQGFVALGTDGFPSDMVAEADALANDAAEHGEDVLAALQRLDVGHDLLAECFGAGPPLAVEVGLGRIVVNGREVVQDGVLRTADVDEIRAHAAEHAPRVWRRMAEL